MPQRRVDAPGAGLDHPQALAHELIEARVEKRLRRLQKHLLRQELLIVAALGFVPLSKASAEMRREVFSRRRAPDSPRVTCQSWRPNR